MPTIASTEGRVVQRYKMGIMNGSLQEEKKTYIFQKVRDWNYND